MDYKNQPLHNNIAAVQHSRFVSSTFLPKGIKIDLQLSPYSPQLPLPKNKISFWGKQVAAFQVVTGNGLQGSLSSGIATGRYVQQ
jgi:hypothetical protein